MTFSIQIASKYRDAEQYPLNTDFLVLNNPSSDQGIIYSGGPELVATGAQVYLENPIIYLWRWLGDTTVASTGYTLANSAMVGQFVEYETLQRIRLPVSFVQQYQLEVEPSTLTNFFKGLLFYLFTSPTRTQIVASTTISFYDPVTFTIELTQALPSAFFAAQPTPPYAFAIINQSGINGNNLNVLGTNTFLSPFSENYLSDALLLNGSSNTAWVENVSKGWALPVTQFDQKTKVATTAMAFPSYGLNDMMQLRFRDPTPTLFLCTTPTLSSVMYDPATYVKLSTQDKARLFGSSVQRLSLASPPSSSFLTGDLLLLPLPTESYEFAPRNATECAKVSRTTASPLQLNLIFPGLLYLTNRRYYLATAFTDPFNPSIHSVIVVDQTSFAVGIQSVVHGDAFAWDHASGQSYLLYAPNSTLSTNPAPARQIPECVFYLQDVLRAPTTAFAFYQPYDFQLEQIIPPYLIAVGTVTEWVPLFKRPAGIVMPLAGNNQPLCYSVRLMFLSMPNQPIQGYNVLPSFFPYFILEVYNSSGLATPYQPIYSNNPNTTRATFMCQIANPRNQVTSTFLVVHSFQANILKWVPNDHIRFRIALPNGETLLFVNDDLNLSVLKRSTYEYRIQSIFDFYSVKGITIQLQFTPVTPNE